jgi:23S rRNA (uracil1939-C5)-methyltransferase
MAEQLPIHELGPLGDGVHQSERGRVFIERALPGDVVETKVQTVAGGILRGDLIQVIEASPHRVSAPCPHYDVCGGCTVQHADDGFYRNWKTGIVRAALAREGVEPEVWCDPVFLPAGRRRRATFAAARKKNVVTLGYHRRRTHQVTDISACLIADPVLMALRAKLATALVPILQDGKEADIFIQTVDGHCEVVITGPVGQKGRPDFQVYEAAAELAHAAKINRICWRLRDRDEVELLLEVNPLLATFGALTVPLPPLAFLQPTKPGEDAIVSIIMDMLPEKGTFADLFAGCGTFTGPMLTRGPVDAYDNVAAAIRALDKAKGPKPLKAIQRDLYRNPIEGTETKRYDAVVFDPPRAGAEQQARALARSAVPLVIGVSCNPGTFARDARILVDGGYDLNSVTVVDQFNWSHHVELVASFYRD